MQLSHISKIFKKRKYLVPAFIFFPVLITILLLSASEKCLAATYYVATNGSDANNGSLSAPWKTITSSLPQLRAGDTLFLRGGTYYESEIVTDIQGTASNRITIKNYPGETPTIDGGYKEFRKAPNSDWKLYDSKKDIFQSVNTYPDADMVYGYFGSDNGSYRLVPYNRYSDLSSDNEDYTESGSIYIGPGVFWNSSDRRIYVRLQSGKQATSMGYRIPSDTDPRSTKLYIFPHHEIFKFKEGCSYIDIEGIDLLYQNNALQFKSESHHISIKDCTIRGGRTPVLVRDGVHNLLFDNITVQGNVPPWIAWSDVKCGTKPGHNFQGHAIAIQGSANTIEVRNSMFDRTWDGVGPTDAAFNLHIHHNIFKGTRDDVSQLGSACYNVEMNHNKMLFVSKGISRNGSGSPPKPGTKYIHHNIIDCSEPMLGGRHDPNNLLDKKRRGPNGDGIVWARPFGDHTGDGYGKGDPWKIYNNTLVFGQDLNNKGAGHEYRIESFYPGNPQEVYNNIFIQIMDHWLAREPRVDDGSQISDGNIYFRTLSNPENYFFRRWIDGSRMENFMSLSEFKSSQYFISTCKHYPSGWEKSGIEADPQLDSDYYPDPNGPAAEGAIPLPADWPGNDIGTYRGALPSKTSGSSKTSGDLFSDPTVTNTNIKEIHVAIEHKYDDVEERIYNGYMLMDSSTLDKVMDGGTEQMVGLRFNSINIPSGATITKAYIQFTAKEKNSETTNLTIRGESKGNAAPFDKTNYDVSSRKKTSASVRWNPNPWNTRGESGPDQRTTDLSSVVQEIVNKSGWAANNSMVFIITGSGERVSTSFNANPDRAPKLYIEYSI